MLCWVNPIKKNRIDHCLHSIKFIRANLVKIILNKFRQHNKWKVKVRMLKISSVRVLFCYRMVSMEVKWMQKSLLRSALIQLMQHRCLLSKQLHTPCKEGFKVFKLASSIPNSQHMKWEGLVTKPHQTFWWIRVLVLLNFIKLRGREGFPHMNVLQDD